MYTYSEDPDVGAWVAIRGACPVQRRINGEDDVEFSFGSGSRTFDFVFDTATLRTFLRVGTDALREIEESRVSAEVQRAG